MVSLTDGEYHQLARRIIDWAGDSYFWLRCDKAFSRPAKFQCADPTAFRWQKA